MAGGTGATPNFASALVGGSNPFATALAGGGGNGFASALAGGTNPFAAALAGTPAAGAKEDPVAAAQAALNKDNAFAQALAPQYGKVQKQASQIAAGHHGGGNFLSRAMGILDYPRAVVASTINELTSGKGPSLNDWEQGIKNHISFGKVLANAEPQALAKSWIGKAINTGVGFAGDIATDPLTYVGGLGVGRDIAMHLGEAAAKELTARTAEDVATKAAAKAAETGAAEDAATAATARSAADQAAADAHV